MDYTELWQRLTQLKKPVLTWYGEERVELSGAVAANWLAKLANFLDGDLLVQEGDVLALALPLHWRTVLWQVAAQALGVGLEQIVFAPQHSASESVLTGELAADRWVEEFAQSGGNVLVTSREELAELALAEGLDVYLVALSALAWQYPGVLPSGVEDANALVLGGPDQLQVALRSQANLGLPQSVVELAGAWDQDSRVLVGVGPVAEAAEVLHRLISICLLAWRVGASVVVNLMGEDKEMGIKNAERTNHFVKI